MYIDFLFIDHTQNGTQYIYIYIYICNRYCVNHWKLFRKLITRKVPLMIVRMLIFWYSKQEMCIRWGQATSDYFTISNGVRQGGILSPRLFAVYVDDLSKQFIDARSGCFIEH